MNFNKWKNYIYDAGYIINEGQYGWELHCPNGEIQEFYTAEEAYKFAIDLIKENDYYYDCYNIPQKQSAYKSKVESPKEPEPPKAPEMTPINMDILEMNAESTFEEIVT